MTESLLEERFVRLCLQLPTRHPVDPNYASARLIAVEAIAGVGSVEEIVDPEYRRREALRMFAVITKAYGEKHRAYHTLSHIAYVLSVFDGCRHLCAPPRPTGLLACIVGLIDLFSEPLITEEEYVVECALWFHDLILAIGSRTNESDSAKVARDFLWGIGCPERFIASVETCILGTAHKSKPEDPLAQLVVDIDLAILAAPEHEFKKYDGEIYREYVVNGRVPIDLFFEKRTELLESMLLRPMLFCTRQYQVHHEARARENISALLREYSDKRSRT